MDRITLSDKASAISEIARNIESLDAEMKRLADELLFLMSKKDVLTVALDRVAKTLL